MRIGCLQFAPQVGDIDNNLNRADSVLSKANPDDLELLDLLVLPELAFTGYNFKTLQEISPFLEPSGSGISSLWARTIALKHNTTVVVGYPEKVDVSQRWPTSPEYYNSAIVVNGEGETVANYRKSFLYMVDETWALEGKGFYGGYIDGLGDTAIGICMDLNPYKFEAPWHAFEFAFHIMEVQANLVIVTMAWLTREDGRMYSRTPAEPDMETLTYWVQRLEPVIRAESEEETIVVFCNRTGTEGDVVYAGTSAVIGIKDGEVSVYGLLGRGVKDLLVVDTDVLPIAKLVNRPEGESQQADGLMANGGSPRSSRGEAAKLSKKEDSKKSSRSPSEHSTSSAKEAAGKTRRAKPPSPKITIPERRKYTTTTGGLIEESPTVPTPTAPSPTPLSARPKITIPISRGTKDHVNTPYPHDDSTREHLTPDDVRIYGGNVHVRSEQVTPISDNSERLSEKYFFIPSQTLMQTPRDPWAMFAPQSPTMTSALVRFSGSEPDGKKTQETERTSSSSRSEFSSGSSIQSSRSGRSFTSKASGRATPVPESNKGDDGAPPRPPSPKSRNASRTGRPLDRRNSEIERPELAGMVEKLEALARRPGSAMSRHEAEPGYRDRDRPRSPKSRNASRTGRPVEADQLVDERLFNISRASIPIAASPGVLAGAIDRPASDIFRKFTSRMNQRAANHGDVRPSSRAEQFSSPISGSGMGQSRSRSASTAMQPDGDSPSAHIEPDETRTLVWSEISKLVGEVMERPSSRSVSRGRQPAADRSPPPNESAAMPTARSESRGISNNPRTQRRFASREGRGLGGNVPTSQPQLQDSQINGSPGSVDLFQPGDNPDDIVAEIIFHTSGCPTHSHSHRNTPTQSNVGTPSQADNPAAQHRNPSRPGQMSNPRFAQRMNSSSSHRASSSPHFRPAPSVQPIDANEMEISIFKAPTPLIMKGRGESTDSCPTMSGASIHTINSPNGSPATPPPQVFEPTTPKAMKLSHDMEELLSASSNPTGSGNFESLKTLGSELLAELALDRPKSAVW